MFEELVSSRIQRQVAPMRGLVVGMLHGIVIAGAIRGTARRPEAHVVPPTPIMVFDQPRRTPVAASAPADPGAPADPVRAPELPPAPVDVPPSLPPVTAGPPIAAAVLRRVLSPGTPVAGPAGGDSTSLRGALAGSEVDEPATVIHQPSPRYPPVLQQAGVQGRVLVEFIIDTSGHIEPASLRVLESSNPGFDAAAGETVRRSVFRPARVRGNPVRQRTIQSIAFRIVE